MTEFDATRQRLVIASNAARLTIFPARELSHHLSGWILEWKILHSRTPYTTSRGQVLFSNVDLRLAFDPNNANLSDLFSGQHHIVAEPGKFIRWQHFLNIPSRGTGHDGDENISISIDDGTQDCIRQLLSG